MYNLVVLPTYWKLLQRCNRQINEHHRVNVSVNSTTGIVITEVGKITDEN